MSGKAEEGSILKALASAGEVGRDLLEVDWEATPLGPPHRWPNSLATIVRVVVSSRFSMWMAWGPELTFFCNDAYRRATLGTKYPWALGRPAREVWAEIWDDIGPRIDGVLETGVATWDESLLLFLERSGYVEETYHTFSYSPLTDDRGERAGMLCVVSEETERVIGERRMATLRELGSVSTAGRDDRDYLLAAARSLATNMHSLPFTLIYLFDEERGAARLAASTGIARSHPAAARRLELDDVSPPWPVAQLAEGRDAVVAGIDLSLPELPTGAWAEPPTSAVLLPLFEPSRRHRPFGFLVVGLNRYRPLDDGYRAFLDLVASQLGSGIASTRAFEAERRRAEQLAELDRAKTAFFTNVSHELRTPLTLLVGPAEDALGDRAAPLPAEQRHRVEIVLRNAERLLKLVNTLLDFSRLESGRATGLFEPVELAQYTSELASMFESMIERAGLALRVDCPPLAEPVYVDREMWAKIVLNLLSNALKFTLEGEIVVRVSAREGRAQLAVIDTGVGIEPAEQGRLFERFHRVFGARARTHEGSGIGLALVAELTQLHGGETRVESTPGVGSTFTVELPFGAAHLPGEQLAAGAREISVERESAAFLAEASRWLRTSPSADGAAAPPAPAPDRARVLVVDDNADMRDYLSSLLAARYAVDTAADGEAAFALARTHPPDLLLTDVMMPGLDGFGLLAKLRADPATLQIPVVMVSARAGEDGVIEGLEAGADDYLVKPFSARELLARVHANLELDRVRRIRAQLERGQQMLDEAERLAEVGSWEIELASGSMRGSHQLLQILRLTPAEFEALDFREALARRRVHPDELDATRGTLEAAILDGLPFEIETRLRHEDGEERWLFVRGEAIRDEHGRPVTLRGFAQDITERRMAQQAIAAAAAAQEAAAREHSIADTLQRSLLPSNGYQPLHLEVATYYQPGVEGTRVGGDWYDLIELGAGRTALVVGDVVGRGLDAATAMGQVRAALRAYARLDLNPADVLELLDALVCDLGRDQLVTCIYAIYNPVTAELWYANAGHLPPLLSVPGEPTTRLPAPTGPPLGVGSLQLEEHRLTLPAGAAITLYTDGLVERRDRAIDLGIDVLAEALRLEGVDVADLPLALVEALSPGGEDDTAILVARTSPFPTPYTALLEVPSQTDALEQARGFTRTTLRQWSLPETTIHDATLLVHELLTNAILHGAPPVRLRLRKAEQELVIEVDDGGSSMPRKLRAAPEDEHGRGLSIVAAIAGRWAARPEGHGKTVWSTIPLPGRSGAAGSGAGATRARSAGEATDQVA